MTDVRDLCPSRKVRDLQVLRDYIGAREDWEQAKNGGDREC